MTAAVVAVLLLLLLAIAEGGETPPFSFSDRAGNVKGARVVDAVDDDGGGSVALFAPDAVRDASIAAIGCSGTAADAPGGLQRC